MQCRPTSICGVHLSANFEDGAVVWYQTFVVDGARTWTAGAVVEDVLGAIAVVGADVVAAARDRLLDYSSKLGSKTVS